MLSKLQHPNIIKLHEAVRCGAAFVRALSTNTHEPGADRVQPVHDVRALLCVSWLCVDGAQNGAGCGRAAV